MKRRTFTPSIIFMTSIFLLACSSLYLPSIATETPQTIITVNPFQTPEIAAQPGSGLENENLLVDIPAGFKIDYQAEQGNQSITEMVAEGESVNDWATLVTVQIFLGSINTTPEQYQETLTQSWFDACSGSESYPVADGAENGYNFVLWQLFCPLNPDTQKVEYAYLKAIQGRDSFYLVQVAFRYEPSSEDITQWMSYFKSVQVCDSRIPERACP